MKLAAIWRHPVKSLQGEQLSNAEVDSDGVRGDRCWGIRDERTGKNPQRSSGTSAAPRNRVALAVGRTRTYAAKHDALPRCRGSN